MRRRRGAPDGIRLTHRPDALWGFGQFLQWGTPDLQVLVLTKDELRGWIRALEWILQKPTSSW